MTASKILNEYTHTHTCIPVSHIHIHMRLYMYILHITLYMLKDIIYKTKLGISSIVKETFTIWFKFVLTTLVNPSILYPTYEQARGLYI